MAVYTRQSSAGIVDGGTIEASDLNDEFDQVASAFLAPTFGVGTAGTDIVMTFDGETNDGVLTWMEDEDLFKFSDAINVGVDDTGYDVKFFGATAGSYWLWDESADGVVQIGSLTVGVDDAGHDVKFFGNAASAYMLWDTSADDLVLAGAAGIDLAGDIDVDGTANLDNTDIDGTLAVDGTTISLDATTSLNIDNSNTSNGITVGTATSGVPISIGHTTSETTVNDNLTVTGTLTGTLATAAQGNVTSLGTLTTLTVDNIITNGTTIGHTDDTDLITLADGAVTVAGTIGSGAITSTGIVTGTAFTAGSAVLAESELELLDGLTAGTAIASKVVTTDSSIDTTGQRNLTISGELDAATLDVSSSIDIAGASQFNSTVTVGVDDTGYDVQFFGDTASAYMLWDTSTDDLIIAGGGGLIVPVGQFTLGAVALTSTATELNLLDALDRGSILYGNASGVTTVLGQGSNGYVLTSDGTDIAWAASSVSGLASDNLTVGDAAVTLSTSSGNITVDATANNSDIIFKGTDATADITMLTLAGADAGAATFNNKIVATELDISGDVDVDGTLEADAITIGSTAIGSIYGVVAGSSSIVTTGALDTGSITSGFGTIDTGASAITTTGLISGGSLDIDNVLINGTTIGHTDDTDLITVADSLLTIDGDVTITGGTPTLIIGDAGAEDAKIVFDGNAQDFHIGLDDTADDLVIGVGSALGTTTAIAVDENAVANFTNTPTVGGEEAKFSGKETIWVPAAAMYPSTTNPCADLAQVETTALRPDLKVLDFATGADEFAQFAIAMPKSWNEGTVTFQPFWTVTGTNAGTVAWQLGGIAASSDDTINTAFGTLVATTALAHSGTSNDLMVSAESGAVTVAGSPAVADMCFFQINRDISADNQSGDARLLGVKLFFTTDAGNDA